MSAGPQEPGEAFADWRADVETVLAPWWLILVEPTPEYRRRGPA